MKHKNWKDEKQDGWPIPMSVLRMEAMEAIGRATDDLVFRLNGIGGVVHQLPLIKFAMPDVIERYPDLGFSVVPEELESATDVGKVYKWEGKDIVLLENVGDGEWIFTPAECIALDK